MNYNVYIEETLKPDLKTLQKKFSTVTFEITDKHRKKINGDKMTPHVCFYECFVPEKNGYEARYQVPKGLQTSVDYWIESVLRRLLRKVKAPSVIDSSLIDNLFGKGYYQASEAYPETTIDCGVLFFKPRSIVTPEAVADLQTRLADCGYAIICTKAFSPTEIKEKGLARKHYLAHSLVAEKGHLLPHERINLLRIYDKESFHLCFHQHAWEVPVMPAIEFMHQYKVPKEIIKEWSEITAERKGLDSGEIDAANEISDCKYVNVFQHPSYYDGKPVFLVNPHMLSLIDWFENIDHPLYVFFIHAVCNDALSWDRMRKEFCGVSDPACSLPGSIRKDCYEGLFPVKIKSTKKVKRIFNCIHLSNGVYESLREAKIWFDIDPLQLNLGKALQKIPDFDVQQLTEATYINHFNNRYALTEITNGKSLDACIEIFKESTILNNIVDVDYTESLRRVDIAHRATKSLVKENTSIVATFISGSASLGRASKDSDVDLIVVTDESKKEKFIERRFEGDVVIECEWLGRSKALEIAQSINPSEMKGLRESARIHFALPLFDPQNLKATITELAKEV
ncbi:MAG TPA: nucleotidyltransferase domain-containing protein, partial [Chitinophagaceae bacterium]|nr:nucleotidyltransferase domain-containing protein [Chitinophagaceae bacterium]